MLYPKLSIELQELTKRAADNCLLYGLLNPKNSLVITPMLYQLGIINSTEPGRWYHLNVIDWTDELISLLQGLASPNCVCIWKAYMARRQVDKETSTDEAGT